MGVVIDQKLGRCHEVMDAALGFWFLKAFIKRATECFHHPDLKWRGRDRPHMRKGKGKEGKQRERKGERRGERRREGGERRGDSQWVPGKESCAHITGWHIS